MVLMLTSKRDNYGRRSGIDRRQTFYTVHVPERRFGKDRRIVPDRRKDIRTGGGSKQELRT